MAHSRVKRLIEELHYHADPLQRAAAAKKLGRLASADFLSRAYCPEAVDPLLAATFDTELVVVQAAIRSLGKLRVERAWRALIALLRHHVTSVRVEAVVALGRDTDGYVLDQRARLVRSEAEQSLAITGDSVTASLAQLLGNVRQDVAESAGKILGGMMGVVRLPRIGGHLC
jgi:HEAT repeat protein